MIPPRKKAGDSLSAREWNQFRDELLALRSEIALNRKTVGIAGEAAIPVMVKNSTGADLTPRMVAGIDVQLYTTTPIQDNPRCLSVISPVEANHAGCFCVIADKILNGGLGQAYIAGVCLCMVNVQDETHWYAEVSDGETAYLKSVISGSAQILWKESGTGEKAALIRFGNNNLGTSETPCELTGTGATANTDTWDIEDPPEDTDGVKLIVGQRMFWSGTEGDPVYYFTRTATFDSAGRLVLISEETLEQPFITGPCEE